MRHGVGDYLNFWREKADLVRDWKKKHQKGNPIWGTPQIGLGRDLSKFQMGSPQTSSGFIPICGPTDTLYDTREPDVALSTSQKL